MPDIGMLVGGGAAVAVCQIVKFYFLSWDAMSGLAALDPCSFVHLGRYAHGN